MNQRPDTTKKKKPGVKPRYGVAKVRFTVYALEVNKEIIRTFAAKMDEQASKVQA
jgi:hypothetical protein